MSRMREDAIAWLKANGYEKYATEPYEKWMKDAEGYTLRIRTTSEKEYEMFGSKRYCGKPRIQGKSVFGWGFSTFYSDDVTELDKLMTEKCQEVLNENEK